MPPKPSFPGRLRELRTAAGLSQEQLAERAGLSRAGISHLEQGSKRPSLASAWALADALGVSVEALGRPG